MIGALSWWLAASAVVLALIGLGAAPASYAV
jgi:hypothetical protein